MTLESELKDFCRTMTLESELKDFRLIQTIMLSQLGYSKLDMAVALKVSRGQIQKYLVELDREPARSQSLHSLAAIIRPIHAAIKAIEDKYEVNR